MIELIRCTNCNETGRLPIVFSLIIKENRCKCCHKSDPKKWTYHFCDIDCFSTWFMDNGIKRVGVKCLDCTKGYATEPNGFAFGFESNGVCGTCNGAKRVYV